MMAAVKAVKLKLGITVKWIKMVKIYALVELAIFIRKMLIH